MNENGDLFADIYAVVLLLGWRNFLNQKKIQHGCHPFRQRQIDRYCSKLDIIFTRRKSKK